MKTFSRSLALVALLAVAAAPVALAQEKKIEITPTVGYRFDSTVSTDGSAKVDSVKAQGAVSYGLTAEYALQPNWNVELLWSHQSSTLKASFNGQPPAGVNPEFADLSVDTIQIGGLWQSGRSQDRVRGYFDFLLGATILNPTNNFDTLSRFSVSLGGGAKFAISDNIGIRAGLRWMPVYINSTDSGYYWCDPYWGCYEAYYTNYLNQFDTHVGVIIKF